MSAVLRSTYGHGCAVNFDWSWCPPARADQAIELRIALGTLGRFEDAAPGACVPWRQRPARDPSQPPIVRVERGTADGHFRVRYQDGAEFAIDATASEIFGVSRGALTLDDLVVYLQGPILGFVLRLRGVTCLHASAAVVDGRAFGVIGPGGMGKSTSAAIFAGLLWSEGVRALYGDPEALPRIVSTWDKRYLDLGEHGYRFGGDATPLGALYVLGERRAGGAAPEITALGGAEAFAHLLANTYANDLLDGGLHARELDVLGRIVSHVPIRLVRAPDDRGKARSVCEAMIADFRDIQIA